MRDISLSPNLGDPGSREVLELEWEYAGTLFGMVTDETGEPVLGGRVAAEIQNGNQTFYIGPRMDGKPLENGSFEISDLTPGDYELLFQGSGYVAKPVLVKGLLGAKRVQQDIVLSRGKSIRGSVTWPNGEPAAGVEVRLLGYEMPEEQTGSYPDRLTKVDDEGNFVMHGFEDGGPFGLLITGVPAGLEPPKSKSKLKLRRWLRENEVQTQASDVVPGGQPLALILGESGHDLVGQLLDDRGDPVKRFKVTLAPRIGNEDEMSKAGRQRDSFESEQGKFELSNVSPGEWGVVASAFGHLDGKVQWIEIPAKADLALKLDRSCTIRG